MMLEMQPGSEALPTGWPVVSLLLKLLGQSALRSAPGVLAYCLLLFGIAPSLTRIKLFLRLPLAVTAFWIITSLSFVCSFILLEHISFEDVPIDLYAACLMSTLALLLMNNVRKSLFAAEGVRR